MRMLTTITLLCALCAVVSACTPAAQDFSGTYSNDVTTGHSAPSGLED